MGKAAFLDLKEQELSLSVFENRRSAVVRDTHTLQIEEGSRFDTGKIPGDISESCLSLPLRMLNFRIINLPFDDEKKVREVIPFEVDRLILGGSDTIIFDCLILGHENGKSQVLVAYIARDLMKSLLDRCRAAGLDPRVVTCLELGSILSESGGNLSPRLLLEPVTLADTRRAELLLREMRVPTINLRKGEYAFTGDEQKNTRSLRTTIVLAVLIVIVFFSSLSLKAVILSRENRGIRDDIRRTYVSLFPQEKKIVNELLQMKSHIKELKEKERSFVGIAPLRVLLDLSLMKKQEALLSEVTIDRDLAVFRGECPSLSDVQGLKKELESYYAEVTITDTKPSSQNRTAFTITAKGKKA